MPQLTERAWFAALVEGELDFVGRCLRARGVLDADLPDACQEVFLVAHRRREDTTPHTSLRPWLYRIVENVARNHRRTLRRRREDLGTEAIEAPAAPGQHLAVEQKESVELALSLLESVDEDKREVFLLHDVEELTMAEITNASGIPLKTGYSRLRAAREQVAAALRRNRARGKS